MGYRRPTYRLEWPEGHELYGLEIRVRGLAIGDLELVSSFGDLGKATQSQQFKALAPLLDIFAEKLISWNFEDDDGQSVGTSREDLARVDMRMMLPIVTTWMSEVSSIPDPLPVGSNSGAPSLVVSLPMELPSPNLTSLPTAN